jgi:biotin synthase
MSINFECWVKTVLDGKSFQRVDALSILENSNINLLHLIAAAGDVRMATFGKKVMIHQINNIQNGLCSEDCGYCGQSKISKAQIKKFAMKGEEEIVQEAHEAKSRGVYRYCMVASGRGPTEKTTMKLAKIIRRIKQEVDIETCLSVGIINDSQAIILKDAGLDRLNHNINTSENYTPNIVSTHSYKDRLKTLLSAKKASLDTCSGIIVGMGESNNDILDVAYTLSDMKVPSIPVNFLIPIPGNPLYDFNQLNPEYCLRILCAFRFINPKSEIRIGGGREGHLRGLQTLALYPANSLFVEGYLVTRGDRTNKVYQMIYDAGFEIENDVDLYHELSSADRFIIDDNPSIMNPKTSIENA